MGYDFFNLTEENRTLWCQIGFHSPYSTKERPGGWALELLPLGTGDWPPEVSVTSSWGLETSSFFSYHQKSALKEPVTCTGGEQG